MEDAARKKSATAGSRRQQASGLCSPDALSRFRAKPTRLPLQRLNIGTSSWRVQLIWLRRCKRVSLPRDVDTGSGHRPLLLRQLLQDQRALNRLVVVKRANGPERSARRGRDRVQEVVRGAAVRAADDAPTRTVPQFCQ